MRNMLFITNRFPQGSIKTKHGRDFVFDLKNNGPSNSTFFCERLNDGSCKEIGHEELLKRLKKSKYNQILLFLHGYSNLPNVVFERTMKFQRLCDAAEAKEVLVVPLIWPCDDDRGIIKKYWDDQKAADHQTQNSKISTEWRTHRWGLPTYLSSGDAG